MGATTEFEHLRDIPLRFEAVLPGPVLRISELLELAAGSVLKTGRAAGETVEVLAGGAYIGSAELADAGQRRAVRMIGFSTGTR